MNTVEKHFGINIAPVRSRGGSLVNKYIHTNIPLTLYPLKRAEVPQIFLCDTHVLPKLAMRNTAELTGGKPIAVLLQSIFQMPYVPNKNKKRNKNKVRASIQHRTNLAKHSYYVISSQLYNTANKINNIYSLNTKCCKRVVQNWLLKLSYDDTEKVITSNDP
jgi:hypothetical protein